MTRPTTDRVREAVFSSLGDLVAGAAVLDLYAGSGALGIEALSRGAASADFVDHAPTACAAIERNLAKTRLESGFVICMRVSDFLRRAARRSLYDLIFADPPYARDAAAAAELQGLLACDNLRALLAPGAVFVLETLEGASLPDSPGWEITRHREYGAARVNYLRKPEEESS